MKRILAFIMISSLFLMIFSCSKSFLDYAPNGTVYTSDLNSPTAVEGLVIAAYAPLSNDFFHATQYSYPWLFGSVRGDDAYKGGGGPTDNADQHAQEVFYLVTPQMQEANDGWVELYNRIGRANEALRRMQNMTINQYPQLNTRQGEMRFLRSWWYFWLKLLYNKPVWVTDSIPKSDYNTITNTYYTRDQFWDKMAEDFQFAIDHLPLKQDQIGRVSKPAAWAALAKLRLYQAYEQDDSHNVTNINSAKLAEVVSLCDSIINCGLFHLNDDFKKNFLCGYENGPESIFAVQFSMNDGTPTGKFQESCGICYNMSPHYGCCDFLNPSYMMLNAFQTDNVYGLPMMDTYNNSDMFDIDNWANLSDSAMISSINWMGPTVDPRLDHTVGIPTHPFKYDPNFIMVKGWRRVPEVYGYLTSMKAIEHYASPCFVKQGPFMGTSRNFDLLRYDDVLLWKAEALIELGQQDLALPLINQIRARAAASTGSLVRADGTPISNYKIGPYVDGVNCAWTQDFARKAMQWERRLEFSTEGVRFLDLVRWGIASETMNAYFANQVTLHPFLTGAVFVKGRDEYWPLSQNQIDLVRGIYQQNPGY